MRHTLETLAAALLVALCLVPLSGAHAADGKLRIVFTGDNGGEVSPCG
ncbi:MAG: hypothetical protein IRZ16_16085 [Myxococcaceae bacterium]|nr:hypothetical protein [Myxococcaceae bacterium]